MGLGFRRLGHMYLHSCVRSVGIILECNLEMSIQHKFIQFRNHWLSFHGLVKSLRPLLRFIWKYVFGFSQRLYLWEGPCTDCFEMKINLYCNMKFAFYKFRILEQSSLFKAHFIFLFYSFLLQNLIAISIYHYLNQSHVDFS